MSQSFETYRGTVYPWEIDHIEHINVQFYVARFDQATWQFLARLGLTPGYFRRESRGMAAVQQNTTYRRELRPGDLLVIESELLEIGGKTLRFVHRMRELESGEEAARSELTAVHIDRAARRSLLFPPDVVAAGRAMLAGGA